MTLDQWLLVGVLVAELGQFAVGTWRLIVARRTHAHTAEQTKLITAPRLAPLK